MRARATGGWFTKAGHGWYSPLGRTNRENELAATGQEGHPTPFNGLAALLVEDHKEVRHVVQRLLSRLGFRVETAESGDSARTILEEHPDGHFDIVLSDLRMRGDLDGRGLATWAHEARPATGVILMSAYVDQHLGIPVRFLPKPFTEQELIHAVSDVLAGRAS